MKKHLAISVVAVVLAALWHSVSAADLVGDYFSSLNTFQADFSQIVIDGNGQELQNSSGEVWIQRPGHFRWDYRTPYKQLVVADGKKLWTYDEDLQQATVKTVEETLSSTPAMLLSGFRPLNEIMTWQRLDDRDGKTWFRMDPKQADAAVEKVHIGFENKQLTVIEVEDGFANRTHIEFKNIKRNQAIKAERFRLELPPGTDIIGDTP